MTMRHAHPLRSPIVWYGGKGQIAHLIVPLLPPHRVYVEPFAGGLSVLFRKPQAVLETINDLDEGVVGFYRVLRDPALVPEFMHLAALTPYARQEYEACRSTWREESDPVQRAWKWFVMVRMAYGGGGRTGHTGFKTEIGTRGSAGYRTSWGYRVTDRAHSAGRRWMSAVEGLSVVHARLQGLQIEQGDWRRILRLYGGEGACVYLDPPYVLDTRTGGRRYDCEMTLDDHRDLTAALLASPAMCVLSGYRHEMTHQPLEDAGWERTDFDVKLNIAKRDGAAPRRIESVWRNHAALVACANARAQQSMVFDDNQAGDERSDDDDH